MPTGAPRGDVMQDEDQLEVERVRFPRHEASVVIARTHARIIATQWGLSTLANDVALVVSELFTNAVIHNKTATGKEVGLTLRLSSSRIRIEVADSGGKFTIPLKSGEGESVSGRGLSIVRELACRIGITGQVLGKIVWAEISLDPSGGTR